MVTMVLTVCLVIQLFVIPVKSFTAWRDVFFVLRCKLSLAVAVNVLRVAAVTL